MISGTHRPISIAIAAMGGQGGGVLAEWIINIAEQSGYLVQLTSVPGLAQRTGATIYYLELFPRTEADNIGKEPVMALMPAPGDVDIVIAGELVESGRAVMRGFVTPDRTTVIASTHRDYALSEKMAMADGRSDHEKIIASLKDASKRFIGFNMAEIAEASGSIISSVLLGALSGAEVLPFDKASFVDAIRSNKLAVESNLAGFESGFRSSRDIIKGNIPSATKENKIEKDNIHINNRTPALQGLFNIIHDEFPPTADTILSAGVAKIIDYQDVEYAHTYLTRMREVLVIDKNSGGRQHDYQLTEKVARYLALWMTYEDTIQVASLKIQSNRFSRLRDEVRAGEGQIVRITEYMHPRVQEICDTLPPWLGASIQKIGFLNKTLAVFCRKGYKIKTTSVSGFLLLYLIAGLRRWRRKTLRFNIENAHINEWLNRIREAAGVNYELAVEIATCQRLIKGYGDTHERGMNNFKSIMSVLDKIISKDNPAGIVSEMREAALADEHGFSLAEKQQQLVN